MERPVPSVLIGINDSPLVEECVRRSGKPREGVRPIGHHRGDDVPQQRCLTRPRRPIYRQQSRPARQPVADRVHSELLRVHQA